MTINIATEAELRNYAIGINHGAITEGAVLLNDINLTGGDWTPIKAFAYEFDGQGHTVSGVTINTTNTGFFRDTADNIPTTVKIKNLKVAGTINSSSTNVGGVIGYVSTKTEITNCRFSGTITGKRIIGGICGLVGSNGDKSIISRCQVEANIYSTETALNPYTSGIVGYCYGKVISQHNAFFGHLQTVSSNYGGVSGIGYMVDGIMTACVARATNSTSVSTNKHGLAYGLSIFYDSFYNKDLFGVYDADGACDGTTYTTQSTYEAFGNFDFVNMWEMDPSDGPSLREVSDYTFVPIIGFSQPEVPSTQPTTLKFHATKAGTITPTLTFTGGPIEVFTETSQVGPVTNYTSQGTFVSGTPKSIALTLGQRLYFTIPAGTSITAMDFTDDQITGTLDSEAIYIEATINLSNSGWRRYYIEKTLEYLDSVGYAGVFHAKDGNIPGIFTDASLTARTNILARDTSIVNVNLAQKGAGTYNFTTSFRATAVNQQFYCYFTRGSVNALTTITAVVKDSGNNVVHTITPAISGSNFTINQTIADVGNYTVEWAFEVGAVGGSNTIDFVFLNGGVTHTFDTKDIPPQLLSRYFYCYSQVGLQTTEVKADLSDFSEMAGASARLNLWGYYTKINYEIVGDINTLNPMGMISLQWVGSVYGDIGLVNWSLNTHLDLSNTPKIIGDVDALKNGAANIYQTQLLYCTGLYGSIQNWKAVVQNITGSPNITGPINSVVTTSVNSTRQIYGSGFTVEELEESIDILANAGFVYKGSFIARGSGFGEELETNNTTTIAQMASLIAGGATIQVKTIAATYDFYLSCHAEVGNRYNIQIYPITPFGAMKITFPVGAFKRTDNNQPITEWTGDLSPDVTCVVAGDYDIRWQFNWDGTTNTGAFSYNGTGTGAMHTFDISEIPDAAILGGAGFSYLPNVTGDIGKCAVASYKVSCNGSRKISGSLASLYKNTINYMYADESGVSGPVAFGAAGLVFSGNKTKMSKSDIAKSLIYLNERDPQFTGRFICITDMPAVTDKKGIEAYDALVARLGTTAIQVNVDRDWVGTVPDLVKNRFNSSVFSRLSNLRRF